MLIRIEDAAELFGMLSRTAHIAIAWTTLGIRVSSLLDIDKHDITKTCDNQGQIMQVNYVINTDKVTAHARRVITIACSCAQLTTYSGAQMPDNTYCHVHSQSIPEVFPVTQVDVDNCCENFKCVTHGFRRAYALIAKNLAILILSKEPADRQIKEAITKSISLKSLLYTPGWTQAKNTSILGTQLDNYPKDFNSVILPQIPMRHQQPMINYKNRLKTHEMLD